MWWLLAPALAATPAVGHTEVVVMRLTEEMHWFAATAVHVERIGCTVGIPVDGDGEPYVGCWFPDGRLAEEEVPKGLSRVAAEARKAILESEERRHDLGSPVRDVRVTWLATERRAWICDQALLPGWFWHTGVLVVGIRGLEAHVAVGGGSSGGGESLRGCTGRPVAIEVPAEVQGRSLLNGALFEGDPAAKAGLEGLLRALPAAVADLPLTPSEPQRGDSAPVYLVLKTGTRTPLPGGMEGWVYAPTDPARILGTRVTYGLLGPDGVMTATGTSLVSGLPDDWSDLAGADVPEGATVRATLEVFATDVPVESHWIPEGDGFEWLLTSTLIFQP